jgi:arginyl-tRNA synthetase
LEKAGYDVRREFYVNDAGNQVHLFGSSISARYMQLCPGFEDYPFPDDGYHGEDIKELAQLVFSAEGETLATLHEEERIARLSGFALPYNIAKMKEHLERYRIHFDEWFLESRLHDSEFIEDTVNILKDGGLIYEKDGALWLKNVELGADKDEVLLRANGFYTYYAVDIAYHRDKIARGFDRVVDIWGADHHGHSLRMKASMSADALGGIGDKLDFLIYQMVSLTRDGETYKVSKRTGRALTLSDLLDEIPVDACRFFFNARPDSHLEFDLDLAVRQDSDNPVYYVQYAHARICSLINMLSSDGVSVPRCADADLMALTSAVELDLIKQIAGLPDEITHAARDYDPSRINKYVIELAARFHRFYNSCRIRGEEPGLLLARLKLADSTRSVIANCLGLLGVTAPTAM